METNIKVSSPPPRLLLMDGNKDIDQEIQSLTEKGGFRVQVACQADDALNLLKKESFDLLLVDTSASSASGLDLLSSIQSLWKNLPLILITSASENNRAIETWKNIAWESVAKPVQPSELARALQKALDKKALVDERDRLRRELDRSQKNYRQLIENSLDMSISMDERGNILSANKKTSDLLGYPLLNLQKMNIRQLMASDSISQLDESLSRLLQTGQIRRELTLLRQNKTHLPVEAHFAGHSKGNILGSITCILRDLRAQKKMEAQIERRTSQLMEKQRILETMYNGLEVGVTMVDKNLNIVKANRYIAQLFRKQPEELIGQKCYAVFGEDNGEKCPTCPADHCLKTALPISIDRKIRTPDGKELFLQHTTFPLLDKTHGVTGFIHFTEDITQNIQLQNQLIQSEKFSALGRLASCISHDLRNPLTVIRNAGYYLKRKVDQKEGKIWHYLDIIEREADQAERIVSDLLTFCRPQPPERKETKIFELIQNLLATISIPDHITVKKEFSVNLPPIYVDPDQLYRVFLNLAQNACEAMSTPGQLTIRAKTQKDTLIIEFQDTGIGIPEKNLPDLFEPFFTSKAKGIGLGLYICKSIIEQHEGTLQVKSQIDQGSTFRLTLPLSARNTH